MSSPAPTLSSPGLAPSAAAVPRSRIRQLAEVAMTMDGVLKLYFGESNLPTPAFLKEAAARAIADGYTYYTPNAGLLSLREAIARHYVARQGVRLDPVANVAAMSSGVQALNLAIRCLLDPGDEALVLTPAWPNGAASVRLANAVAHELPQVLHGTRYAIDFDALEAAVTPRTRLLLLTSPSNPLGWVATPDEQRRTLEFCRRHRLWLLSDEVYERLTYDTPIAPSILCYAEPNDAVVVVQSFSKAYCMTGWRLGWLAGRADLIAKATQANEFIMSCPAGFTQKVGEVALDDGEPFIAELLTMLRANRDLCLSSLRAMPDLTVPEPEGAFYLFPRVAGVADSYGFCERVLHETKVGLAPGVAFGAGGEGSIRLCYAAERHILEEALARLGGFLERR